MALKICFINPKRVKRNELISDNARIARLMNDIGLAEFLKEMIQLEYPFLIWDLYISESLAIV